MNNLSMLVWLTQLGMSVAAPLAGFTLLALWLRQQFSLGSWVVFVGIGVGLCSAVESFRTALKTMARLGGKASKDKEPVPLSFNDHH